ncbi:FecR family protein [Mucilaginibacter pocheonensis]|uniref:Ferric-dicitrate binding protein FerR (Iron transport regulator) n=1 Tax=Mucilaginibacter pocheonensis TaxID=398050 RepID=A0ABU1THI7_9SPHI|nr:FecR family protein [Mucilaginibacter pocheonensis]MDR6944711.1 ferric-dicitrate binding protein FerR (iron transport regulator) [Mucilaginibacter pocheonensis]
MKKKLPADLLEKYFAGNCNEQEIAEIRSWYESFELDQDDVSNLSEDEKKAFKITMWNSIEDNIKAAENDNIFQLNKGWSTRFKSVIYWVTSSAAVLLILFLVKYKVPSKNSVQENNEKLMVTNTTNTIRKVILSDSSMVWISPQSTLTYLKVFDKNKREVTLTGEAFFEVTKDHKRPFSIYTGNVVTKVWGTSFRIRSYVQDKTTRVNVITGKVSVSLTGQKEKSEELNAAGQTNDVNQGVMLLPNQEAVYDKQLDHLQKNDEVKDTSIDMWKKMSLSFNNTRIKEVFAVLNKNFHVHISSGDEKINSDYLKADFTNENLPAIMDILKKTLDVNYTVHGNEFVLESNK